MQCPQMLSVFSAVLIICMFLGRVLSIQVLIQRLEDDIGAENFTYYRLVRPGFLKLELKSIKGDVDVYISSESQHPSYNAYDLKSETCGLDVISIPDSLTRPVFIGLFGHPNYLASRYQLSIYEVEKPQEDDYESYVNKFEKYYYDDIVGQSEYTNERKSQHKTSTKTPSKHTRPVDDELPLWWKILLGIIEFGIEVIL